MKEEQPEVTLTLHLAPEGGTATSPKGIEVLAITAGIGNQWVFAPDVLKASLPLWDGAQCFTDHTPDNGKHSVRDLGGILSASAWDENSQGIRALLLPTGPAAQVIKDLALAAVEHPDLPVGLSADILLQAEGRKVTRIVKVKSLDAVTHPARGGQFLRVIEQQADQPPACDVDDMSRRRQSVGAHVFPTGKYVAPVPHIQPVGAQYIAPDLYPPIQGVKNMKPEQTQLEENSNTLAALLGETECQQRLEAQLQASDKVLAAQCAFLLTSALSAAHLPDVVSARLRKQYEGQVFEAATLQASIDEARLEVKALTGAGAVQGPRISGMFNTDDQVQLAVDDLFGIPREADKANLKAARLSGIRELYLMLTGDHNLYGGIFPEAVQLQMTTANFPVIVKNAMNKVLAQAWAEFGKAGYNWWEQVATIEHLNTVNDVTWSIFGTVGSLPTVSEGGEYTPLKIGDGGETSAFVKKGGYFGVTLEVLDRDDIRALKQAPRELAFAAIREISATVAALFTDGSGAGPLLADGGRLFNATAVATTGGHKNLLTAALGTDYTAWEAVAAAMYAQPMLVANETGYYGTGKAMAIEPKFCLVPRALRGAANTLFVNRQSGYGVENLYYGQVFPITVPDFTDTTDWAAVADPHILPGVMIGERFGLMPEIFVAGNETDPAVFMNDESRIKVRSFSAIGIADWRALHKSNVAGG